jgi:nitrite reductase/ring-hydroxylating ferredoxin subunit
VEFPSNAADVACSASLGRSETSQQQNVQVASGSHVFAVSDQSRSKAIVALTMKSAGIASDPMALPTVWSAPLDEVRAGCSAKFHILWRDRLVDAFVVNFDGHYYAYVNYCIHAGTPLDWWPNEFFDDDRRFLICGTHGSLYEPHTGKCAGGPCRGGSLFPLNVQIMNGRIVVSANCNPQK